MQKVIPKKHLGQHFLVDSNVKQRILEACRFTTNDVILEIGPGLGVLTRELIQRVKHVYAIEVDSALCRQLQNEYPADRLKMIQGDFLRYPLDTLPSGMKVIGNLPYNISTPIIEKLIANRSRFKQFFFTVQLEFGNRLAAKPDSRDYGAFSCFVQYYADIQILFKIRNTAFRPVPKVTSCFLRMTFREPVHQAQDEILLFQITRHAFQQRRKKIGNALGTLFPNDQIDSALDELNIDQNARAENLTLRDFVELSRVLGKQK